MKRIILALAALAALASCKKAEDCGLVSFSVAEKTDIVEMTKSVVSDYTALPSTSDFDIAIKNSSSSVVWSGKLSEYDAATQYAVGNYTVDASYGAEGEEGFDKPWFVGKQSFAVTAGQTTSVSIPVALGNSLVKVACSAGFLNYFPEYSFTLTTGSGTVIPFPQGETRAAFIDAYRFAIAGTMKSQTGATTSFSKEYSSGIEAATCYTLRFDVSNVGGLTVTITFNDTTETIDLGDVELND